MFVSSRDRNQNYSPQIYVNAVNPNNPAPFMPQVYEFLNPLREAGLQPVPVSAYLNKATCGRLKNMHQYCTKSILEDLAKHAKLAGNQRDYDIVFVWDIEEITMLTRSCLAEVRMMLPHMCGSIQWLWVLMTRILGYASFHINSDLLQGELANIEDAFIDGTDGLRTVVPKYAALQQLYNEMTKRFEESNSAVSHELLEKCGLSEYEQCLNISAENHQNIFHQRWKYAKRSLALVNERSAESHVKKFANVVMTKDELSLGIAQLLISGASKQIPIENVYSTLHSSDVSVWEGIQKRFGEKCLLVHVASRYLNFSDRKPFTFWPVKANESIKYLYKTQRDVLLKDKVDS